MALNSNRLEVLFGCYIEPTDPVEFPRKFHGVVWKIPMENSNDCRRRYGCRRRACGAVAGAAVEPGLCLNRCCCEHRMEVNRIEASSTSSDIGLEGLSSGKFF